MDQHDQQAPERSHRPAVPLSVPARLEWTRQPGTGPSTSILGPLTGRTVVELGYGSGHNLAHLVAVHHAIGFGIDHNPTKISRARDQYGQIPGLTFVQGDAAAVLAAMPPAAADVCLSIFGAFSFSPPRPLLHAAAHALRAGGRLAITLRADDRHDHIIVLVRKDTGRGPPEHELCQARTDGRHPPAFRASRLWSPAPGAGPDQEPRCLAGHPPRSTWPPAPAGSCGLSAAPCRALQQGHASLSPPRSRVPASPAGPPAQWLPG
jgi:SAM-dependent methyltransferase